MFFETFYVSKRPYLEYFLKEISKHFELIVWTAGEKLYADTTFESDDNNIASYRASCSDNYRQLQLLRGVRAVEETEEDRQERAMTRSEAKVCQLSTHLHS